VNHWLFLFRPDTFEKVKKHQTLGVREAHKKRFAELKKGDCFVCYISQVKRFCGYGTLVSDPFEEDTLIFADDQVYPWRCKVKFEDTNKVKEGLESFWGLAPFEKSASPANLLMCHGGFMKLTPKDFEWLVGELG